MISTESTGIENLTLNITQEIHVRASLEVTFAALLEQLGPANEIPEQPMPMQKLEAWPGGRWFRDLGDGNGHFWGSVQAIKRPTLLEITGPLFMSYAVVSNLQYRLERGEGWNAHQVSPLLALGLITDDHRKGVSTGWTQLHDRIRARAEAKRLQ